MKVAGDEAACSSYRFQPNSPDFTACLQRQSLARQYSDFGVAYTAPRWWRKPGMIAEDRRYVVKRCEGLVRDCEPLLVWRDRELNVKTRRYEALWLPLSADGQHVTMLLAAMIYDAQREQLSVVGRPESGRCADRTPE